MNTELNNVVDEIAKSFGDFKQKHTDQLNEQEARLYQMETAQARKSFSATTGDDSAALGTETRALKSWFRGKDFDTKALSVTDDGQGVTVRADWQAQIFKLIRESSPMRQVANVRQTDSNSTEVLIDRGEAASAWTTETGTRSDTTIDFLTRQNIANHEHYAYPSVTQQMLEDSQFDVEQFVQGKVGNRFGRQEADAFVNGDGIGKPRGILNYGTIKEASLVWGADPAAYTIGAQYTGVNGGLNASNAVDALYDVVDSLKVGYLPGSSWIMPRAMRNLIRKIKDADGRSLFEQSLQVAVPDRLMGYPIYLAEDFPALAADSVGLLFGNFREAYTICDRAETSVLRDPYTKPGFVKWYVRRRVGGALTNPEAVKALILGTEPV